jgi:hypothetical protein
MASEITELVRAPQESLPATPHVPHHSQQQRQQQQQQQQQQQTLAALQQQIRQVELGSRGLETDDTGGSRGFSSGLPAIDRLLPEGGYLPGTLVEWLVPGRGGRTAGFGVEWLALQVARRAMQDGGTLVVVDPANEFYPLAARQAGIHLEQVVILRGERLDDLYWSLDQALRCEGVAAVFAAATSARPRFLVDLPERWHRRFQLSAEAGGALGLFIRPSSVARAPSWSDIQWRLIMQSPPSGTDESLCREKWTGVAAGGGDRQGLGVGLPADYWWRPMSLQLVKCRGGRTGPTVHFNLNTRTGELQSATELVRKIPSVANPPERQGESPTPAARPLWQKTQAG